MPFEHVEKVLINQDPGPLSNAATMYICSIATVIDTIEKQRAIDANSPIFPLIKTQASLFDQKRNEGSVLVAELDEDSLQSSLFQELEGKFAPRFWSQCSHAGRSPSDTLCLLTLRYQDYLWQTNLVDQFCESV